MSETEEIQRRARDLEGGEIVLFAGTAWRVDATWQTPHEGWHVRCRFGRRSFSFDVDGDQLLDVIVDVEGGEHV